MYLWNRRSDNKTHTTKMYSIPTSQTTDMVRRNIITPEAVWEERSTRKDSWLHSAGWLIRVIKRKRRRRRCLVCFDKGHDNIVCTKNISCRICKDKHSTDVHVSDNHNSSTSTSNNRLSVSHGAISNLIGNVKLNDTCSDIDNSTYMPIVNVVINNVYYTIALLDTASSNTFITIQAANNASLSRRPVSYNLATLGASNRIDTKLVGFTLSSEDGKEALDPKNVYLTKDIPCSHSGASIKHYDHLSDIKLVKLNPGSQVEVLIGQDNVDALIPIHVRRGLSGHPFAMQTLFGWTLNGILSQNVLGTAVSNFISTSISTKTEELCAIQDISIAKTWSVDAQKVIDHCGEESRVIECHMGLPIPWKKPAMTIIIMLSQYV